MNIGCSVVIYDLEGKIFIAQRSRDKKIAPLQWENIGGHLETNESLEECIRRETKEEIGCELFDLNLLSVVVKKDEKKQFVLIAFSGRISGDIQLKTDEIEKVQWVNKDELDSFDFCFDCRKEIDIFFKKRRIMNQSPELIGQRILLRKPEKKDIEDRLNCGRTYEYVRGCGGDTRKLKPFTKEDAFKWFDFINSNEYEWVIEFENKCIGTARLTINEKDKRGKYAIGIFDVTKLSMGLGTEATNLVLDYSFNVLKLHRVDLRVLEYNRRAICCYEKCGFVKEGVEREGAFIEDRWESDVIMGILEDEFHRMKKAN
ncbi:MAG TPA: GNAT family N-acetyltransferase [Bacillota bacterium]|nr:GNAT family N-acetyltransferase [Bacillota bacterium]